MHADNSGIDLLIPDIQRCQCHDLQKLMLHTSKAGMTPSASLSVICMPDLFRVYQQLTVTRPGTIPAWTPWPC
jgi:hypothetical protein